MEKSNWKGRSWRFLFLWFCIVSQLMMFSVSDARLIRRHRHHRRTSSSSLKLTIMNGHVVMENGLVKVTLSAPGGMVTGIEYKRIDNLLEFRQKESRRGYWDIVWGRPGKVGGNFEMIEGTKFKVIAKDENKIELSFTKHYNISADLEGTALPLNIDKRFILFRGQSGLYSYAIFERLEGWPALGISTLRLAFKLQFSLFNYMAVSDTIQRPMPTEYDRIQGHTLDYREAVLLTNGEVDDKYQYSKDTKDNHLHGWISPMSNVGFWVITPSNEYRTGGPFKQELTSHVGPTALVTFSSNHYAGQTLSGLNFQEGEPWKKVFGPVYIYLNSYSGNEKPQEALWKDAQIQLEKETRKWPYDFPMSNDFPPADQRGWISGRLLINDTYLNENQFPAKFGYVGLAPPGDEGSWQLNGKGYQFWTQTNENGYFTIKGLREGIYNLFGSVPGILGDYKYQTEIDIKPGSEYNLGNLVFSPPRNGPTLWEIGIPDRTAAEFYIPDPIPRLRNHLFDNHTDKWRQYGLWDRYTDLYPDDQELVYTVGVSNYSKDWFFAHVNKRMPDKSYAPTTRQILFDMGYVIPEKMYTFRVALASSNFAYLQIRINRANSPRPHFSTMIGRDNAIARHGIHGLYWSYSYSIPGKMLVEGTNTFFLKQATGGGPFNGLMYDYLRLEGPT